MSKDRIIDKVKKCLRLAASAGEHEAAIAMRQAQKLMEAHNLSMAEVELSDVQQAAGAHYRARNLPNYLVVLAQMVGGIFGCEVLQLAKHSGRQYESSPLFIGIHPNNELAQYAYDTLSRQLIKQRTQYRKRVRASTRAADLYSEGWVWAAQKQTSKLALPEEQKALISRYMSQECVVTEDAKTRVHKPKKAEDIQAILNGTEDGENVQIYAGMRESDQLRLSSKGI